MLRCNYRAKLMPSLYVNYLLNFKMFSGTLKVHTQVDANGKMICVAWCVVTTAEEWKKAIEALRVWLIADRSGSPNIFHLSALVHQASSWDCCQMSPFINILQKNKCRPLPLRWIMNQGWRISVVTNTWMGVWQLQQLQFNPLSAHWNIPNCHNLNSITTDNNEVMSSITAKDTTHS